MNPELRVWHPFTQEALDPAPIRVTKAEGVYLYTDEGRRLIDGISSWWVNLHGHGHPAIVSAIAAQAAKVDHVLLAGFTHDAVEELRECLRKILPASLSDIFFSDDGSTAVEVALKMAVQYWQNIGRPAKRGIVALDHAYHGDTVGAMSVGATSAFSDPFRNFLFPVHRVHSAYCYRCPVGKARATCSIDCVDKLRRLLEEKHGEIAAVIVERSCRRRCMIVHPVEFLQRVRRLCTEHGVLLIADEVLTGFGRCGKMFACSLAGVEPDLMCLSKGLTGGVLRWAPRSALRRFTTRSSAGTAPALSITAFLHGNPSPPQLRSRAAGFSNASLFSTASTDRRDSSHTACRDQRAPGRRRRPIDRHHGRNRAPRGRPGLCIRAST